MGENKIFGGSKRSFDGLYITDNIENDGGEINIANDTTTTDINIGTGAKARAITIGNITGATSVLINSGTDGIGLNSTGAGDILLDAGDKIELDAVGAVDINSSGGAINIGND